ncbi:MAG: DUF192 domain-containing protein [Acidimicrobiales bacterium]
MSSATTDSADPGATATASETPSPRLVRIIWWAAALVIGVAGVGILLQGANRPDDPELGPRQALEGFDEVAVEVESPDGETGEWCLLVAETDEQRARGLMDVTDPELGGYDGMLFRFADETEVGFWMMNTSMALTVAYIAGDGSLVSTQDMAPCVGDAASQGCPSYPPAGSYRWAVEVPQGRLSQLGIVAGSRFTDTGQACTD